MSFEKELAELRERKEKALQMGGAKKIEIQHDQGKLTARERIPRLLDPDTFLEVGLLNCSDVPGMEDKTPADSKVAGYGKINGRTVAVTANDFTVLAATSSRVARSEGRGCAAFGRPQGFPLNLPGRGRRGPYARHHGRQGPGLLWRGRL